MAMEVLKVEVEMETCCICGSGGELATPEEYDASVAPLQVPLRNMLLHLNHNKVIPEGRFCGSCITRTVDAYELSTALSSRGAPALSDKIRALRRRLHELTQKIDVFIVVGGPGAGAAASYSEDDIIMVEKDALAAAAAADEEDVDHARNARGDQVYQCSVCPLSFQRVSELRAHAALHPADARHSCWTCGAQFESRRALADHAAEHAGPQPLLCNLCDAEFTCQASMRAHEARCAARCPACGALHASRAALAEHARAAHGRAAAAPHLCPACFRTFATPDLLSAHTLTHRQAKQFVCGYGECVLRFGARANLLAHIRKAHAADLPPAPPAAAAAAAFPCDRCDRTFASSAAQKRHLAAHLRNQRERRAQPDPDTHQETETEMEMEVETEGDDGETVEQVMQYIVSGEAEEGEEGEVEYLEVETLEEGEYVLPEDAIKTE